MFSYLSDTIKKGNKDNLEAGDIMKLRKVHTSQVLVGKLEK